MKVGLIPPIAHLNEFGQGEFHLILSHLLDTQPEYRNHYRDQASQGAFLLLDNSAHELGIGQDPEILLGQADDVGASEIACPDALFNADLTIEMTTRALRLYKKEESFLDDRGIRLMIVPQAESIWEWGQCLKSLMKVHQHHFPGTPFTVGVSKDYEKWPGGVPNLIARFVDPARDIFEFDVHLLGWGRHLHVLSALSARFPWIRSTDSAKPFVYAYKDLWLTLTSESPTYPTRPANYFDLVLSEEQLLIAKNNVRIFHRRARV